MFTLLGCLAVKTGGRYCLSHSIPRIESGDKYTMNKSNYVWVEKDACSYSKMRMLPIMDCSWKADSWWCAHCMSMILQPVLC